MSRSRRRSSSFDSPRRSVTGRERNNNAWSRDHQLQSASAADRDRSRTTAEDVCPPLTPWEAFQEHLRSIDDNSAMYTFRDPTSDRERERERERERDTKKQCAAADENKTTEQKALEMAQQLSLAIKVKNSDVFLKTMQEFQLRRQQHLERLAAIQKERERRARELDGQGEASDATKTIDEEDANLLGSDWSDAEEEAEVVDNSAVNRRVAAARGWAKIRRYIEEKAMERKQKNSAMSWTFLRQTITNMTDLEKGRQNLYERYLVNPNSWKDGFTNFPNELFDKERVRERRMYGSQPNLKRMNNSKFKKTKSLRSEGSFKSR